ncbi:hypothetical protein A2954_01080 [Candidatus Roizmanbacteria bacterium RIFCSPLOWO2_01_FULL_37_12]|uniref:Sortase n=1 Tax=Candidatus Roizmanbacteria bacterium RIFCSPLOWO2_01_FULL_37_12 TaxID=1802056 RepID=A0A1F7IGD5_9BACT|nr:MAG: hypothetical protein A3D76_01885 [Candidatus Roizmanbacteria bacterium RIFCSPHIGHO2_02_FULL_37_9b]OGK42420.1 MAG: hypothetical protein A2954_01080 [Candidatus Roizmanbacteria bacterium RIFCSPLOWO2_01_FULL_37_12]
MSRLNIYLLLILVFLLIFAQQDSALVDDSVNRTPAVPAVSPSLSPTPTPTIPQPRNFDIPKIDVSAPIVPVGVDETGKMQLPENINEVGWFEPGFKPGEKGSAVISGHLDSTTGEGAIFYHLHELEPGDSLYVTDELGAQYTFVVTRKEIYEYDKVPLEEVFGESSKKHLNLITCTGQWNFSQRNYSHRMIIYSELQSVSRLQLSPTM